MNTAGRAETAESPGGASWPARAAWWIAAASTLAICVLTLHVLTEGDGTPFGSESAIQVMLVSALWISPALIVLVWGRRAARGWWQIVCALLTGAMAFSMLVGDPSMAEGGVWFGYVLIFMFVPLAVVATLFLFGGAIIGFVKSVARAGSG